MFFGSLLFKAIVSSLLLPFYFPPSSRRKYCLFYFLFTPFLLPFYYISTMKKMKKLIVAVAAVALLASCGKKELKLNENNIDQIVAAMTLEEKAALVTGVGMDSGEEGLSATIGAQAELVPGAAG